MNKNAQLNMHLKGTIDEEPSEESSNMFPMKLRIITLPHVWSKRPCPVLKESNMFCALGA